jgi:RecA/RadA recombinase
MATQKSKMMEKLLKNSTVKFSSILSESVMFNDKDNIPTDIPIFNIAFSGSLTGGIASGLTLLAGPSKSFKSLSSLVCVKAYLDKYTDAVCVLYDSEGGMTPDMLKSQGVDPSRVLHIPIDHLEMLKFDLVKQLQEINRGDKVIFVIDSIGNTASLKELNDALEEKSVAEMQRAKTIKALFRMVTPSLVNKDIPCICICHTYQEMTMYPKQIISGGTGLIYSANQAFIIGKSQEKDGTELAGWNFTLNVEKSRFVREKSKLTFRVLYESGIQKYSGLLDMALEAGLVQKP